MINSSVSSSIKENFRNTSKSVADLSTSELHDKRSSLHVISSAIKCSFHINLKASHSHKGVPVCKSLHFDYFFFIVSRLKVSSGGCPAMAQRLLKMILPGSLFSGSPNFDKVLIKIGIAFSFNCDPFMYTAISSNGK